jgi:signal transduction histidine kinase
MAVERARAGVWHRRLAARYAATLAAVALGSTLLVAAPLYLQAAALLEQALDERLEGTAELSALDLASASEQSLALAVQGPQQAALRHRLEILCREADLDEMYLVSPAGKMLLSVGESPVSLTSLDIVALRAAATSDATNTPIQIDASGERFLTAYAPIGDGDVVLGVRASAPYLERLDALRDGFWLAAIVWGVVVAVLGGALGAQLTRPIERLLRATQRLAAGEAPAPPKPGGSAELDALQNAFAEMAASVHQRERRLRALAGAVAHEVRNPSNALRLHLGLLRRNLGVSAPQLTARVDVLEGELDALDATVDGFLVFAHDRAPRRAPVALRALLERVAEGATVHSPETIVDVDPLLVGRAVANLVRNAREAGGDPVVVRAAVVDNAVCIEVEDVGPGFAADLLPRAFEPFVSGRVGGSGLGLAIVAAVAVAHGGTVSVARSAPGSTVVVLRIPGGRDR